jgi:hypothetical protein
MRKGNKE